MNRRSTTLLVSHPLQVRARILCTYMQGIRMARTRNTAVGNRTFFAMVCLCGMLWAAAACGAGTARPAAFRLRPDSTAPGAMIGPFDGKVVDAATRQPINGAMVYATWAFESGAGMATPAGRQEATTVTDISGRYLLPQIKVPAGVRLTDVVILVYKRGFVAYRSDRRFTDLGPRFDFAQTRNVVELDRWRDDYSHVRHVRFVGGGPAVSKFTQWELAEAAAELADRGKPKSAFARGVVAAQLLLESEIKALTKYDGSFETGPLMDEPDTNTYTSQHFAAIGREESWDIAIRMWRLPSDKALAQFETLLSTLPGATETDRLGTRGFATVEGPLVGIGFVDVPRGAVVLLTCGRGQCSSDDTAFALAKLTHDRITQLIAAPTAAKGPTP